MVNIVKDAPKKSESQNREISGVIFPSRPTVAIIGPIAGFSPLS
jgi:hypothetical protein